VSVCVLESYDTVRRSGELEANRAGILRAEGSSCRPAIGGGRVRKKAGVEGDDGRKSAGTRNVFVERNTRKRCRF